MTTAEAEKQKLQATIDEVRAKSAQDAKGKQTDKRPAPNLYSEGN